MMSLPNVIKREHEYTPPRHSRFTKKLGMKNTADVTGGKPIAVLFVVYLRY
jgi:hypothetical protein